MKREPELYGRNDRDRASIEGENRAEVYPQIIDQQIAEMQEEDWENTERHQEHNLEQTAPEAPETLDRRILRLLSAEDEKHIERILEEVNGPDPFSDSAKAEVPVSLSELVSCLMRLKMDGKVQEAASGYFSRTGQ